MYMYFSPTASFTAATVSRRPVLVNYGARVVGIATRAGFERVEGLRLGAVASHH